MTHHDRLPVLSRLRLLSWLRVQVRVLVPAATSTTPTDLDSRASERERIVGSAHARLLVVAGVCAQRLVQTGEASAASHSVIHCGRDNWSAAVTVAVLSLEVSPPDYEADHAQQNFDGEKGNHEPESEAREPVAIDGDLVAIASAPAHQKGHQVHGSRYYENYGLAPVHG